MAMDKVNVEELKKAKDGLDVLPDLLRYAETGFSSIQPQDFPLFRWYGLYQQRPNEGYFMLRIKVPNGHVNAAQLRACGHIAIDFGRDLIDITTRQDFQYHWLTVDQVPEIFRRLKDVGMTSSGACGDITRNVVGCPVAGLDSDEIINALPLVDALTAMMLDNKEFSNLPRKYKISVSGCRDCCAQPEINCVGVYGAEWQGRVGYGIMVGGGLSTNPYFGADMGAFLKPEEVVPVVKAVSEMFRDATELRQNRGRARLKFLLHDPKIGIGGEEFRNRLEAKLGYQLERGGPFPYPKDAETDHIGIRKQKQDGLYYVGLGVRAGRLTGQKLLELADVVEEFSAEKTGRCTAKQNFIITHVPEAKLEALKTKLDQLGLDYKPSVFKRALVSCTGIEFCNLAVTETKEVGRRVSRELEERFPNATKNLRIHFSGCPNNCGQNAIGDIGLRGGKTKGPDGVMIEAFDILVGGGTGAQRAFAEVCTRKHPSDTIANAIGNLYQAFLDWSKNGESFYDYVKAHSKEQMDAVARGLPEPEPAPAGAETAS